MTVESGERRVRICIGFGEIKHRYFLGWNARLSALYSARPYP